MSYPGNPSLSADVQQRILSTFDQTLDLTAEGSHQEALLGCDFVLRMDPQFQPARLLQERLRGAAGGAVHVDDLRAAPAAAAPSAHDPFGTLDGLSLDLPELPEGDLFGNATPPAPAADLRSELAALLGERRFPELLARAQQNMAAVAADQELQRIAGFAQERLEAEPYVVKFLGSAREAQRKGDLQEVERLVAKARSLDPSHPGIAELERSLGAPAAAPQPAPAVAAPSPFAAPASPFDSGSFGGDSESARRIQELLQEGQAAFDAGDPQAAIDAWSRIFLIDIDHQEASRRIEGARKLKAEKERQVEEIFHDGLAGLESGELDRARRAFQQVIELQPGHITAREYLDQLAAGSVPVVRTASREMPAVSAEPALPMPSDFEGGPLEDLKEEILVPPDPSEVGARPAPRRETKTKAAAPRERRAGRMFLVVGAVVLLLVAAGGWWFFQNRARLFPNSDEDVAASLEPTSPISRAVSLQQGGKTARAIAMLRRIAPSDPHYKEAQALIAKWEGAAGPSTAAPAGPSPEVLAKRQGFLDQARSAYGERSYLMAVDRYSKAASLAALDPPDAESFADAKRQIEPLKRYVDLYQQHDWEFYVRDLWEMHLKDPNNRDVNRLLVDTCYNLGVVALQRADMKRAAESFQDALSIAPDDPTLRRHLLFAQTYQGRDKDLLYRIYVKYIPTR